MGNGTWRLLVGGAWLAVAGALAFRSALFPPEFLAKYPNLWFGVFIAVVLAAWNFARFYQSRPKYAVRTPLESRKDEAAPYEYIPELDFQKMDRENAEEQTDSPQRHRDTEKQ